MVKVDGIKVMAIAGTILGIGATLLSNVSSDKKMKAEIAEQVQKALSEKK